MAKAHKKIRVPETVLAEFIEINSETGNAFIEAEQGGQGGANILSIVEGSSEGRYARLEDAPQTYLEIARARVRLARAQLELAQAELALAEAGAEISQDD